MAINGTGTLERDRETESARIDVVEITLRVSTIAKRNPQGETKMAEIKEIALLQRRVIGREPNRIQEVRMGKGRIQCTHTLIALTCHSTIRVCKLRHPSLPGACKRRNLHQ